MVRFTMKEKFFIFLTMSCLVLGWKTADAYKDMEIEKKECGVTKLDWVGGLYEWSEFRNANC